MTFYSPARLERTRLWLARSLLASRPLSRLAVALVPKNHPWKWWFESQTTHLEDVTRKTLRPRVSIAVSLEPFHRRKFMHQTVIAWAIFYLAVADVVSVLPGPGLVSDPVTPLHWAGLTDEPWVAPSIPEMVQRAVDATVQ